MVGELKRAADRTSFQSRTSRRTRIGSGRYPPRTVSATRGPPRFSSRAELTAPAMDGNLESRQRQGRDNQGSNAVILIPQIFSSPQVVNPGALVPTP